jgi:hypothetical protein
VAAGYEKVAMVGQVPVRVKGKVSAGDVIVATGSGVGEAIPAARMTVSDYARALGVAWEPNDANGIKLVRVGVGLPSSGAWRTVQAELERRSTSESARKEEKSAGRSKTRSDSSSTIETHVDRSAEREAGSASATRPRRKRAEQTTEGEGT